LNDVTRSADALVDARHMEYTHRGFILASLSFLEKNKDLFPDSYTRAIQLCEKFRCDDPDSDFELVEAAFSFAGLVRGIGTLNKAP